MGKPWGKIAVGTRLEKQVEADFVIAWTSLIMRGLKKGDAVLMERGKPAHQAANGLIRQFLKSGCDTLWFLDSDADVGWDFLNQFRAHEPGWEFDALQAFYARRGWPPEAIWFKQSEDGQNLQCMVTGEGTEAVSMIGTHCAMFRREIFEKIYQVHGADIDLEDFEWFCYPRHEKKSDETQLSIEAIELGYKLGATTAVKAGHISKVVTGWETYQEYLDMSGTKERTNKLVELAQLVAGFTGEALDTVIAKAAEGPKIVSKAWERVPAGADATRLFYGGSEYLYDLANWNVTPLYQSILSNLAGLGLVNHRCLIIGGGLGNEALQLNLDNDVDVFELPGKLREFLQYRFTDGSVTILEGDTLQAAIRGPYDLIVAIDVIEHVHPDEIQNFLDTILCNMGTHATLFVHNTFDKQSAYPMHYNHTEIWEKWLKKHKLEKVGPYEYRKVAGN